MTVLANEYAQSARDTAVVAMVQELQLQFADWSLRREIQDQIRVKSILSAWGFYEGAKWQNQ